MFDDVYVDENGRYIVEATNIENGIAFEWRKYMNSPRVRRLGGAYANACPEKNIIKFYRNDYIRAYPKFVEENT